MTMRVILGYRTWGSGDRCPYCGDRHFAVEDDGQPDSYRVLCWCGAKARVRKDDPDLLSELERQVSE